MARLTQLIREIHRRSLWQVLTVYLGASWAVLEVTDQIVARYLLPEWVYPAALILLLVGLPIVLATALVREEREPAAIAEPRDPTLLGEPVRQSFAAAPLGGPIPTPVAQLLTWPRAILGGVVAFTALGLVSAFVVVRGTARVTEAYGAAGEAFEERAWILVAEFQTQDDAADVAPAALTALTVDLQQSRYVNVYGRDQIPPVLRRMGLPDTTSLQRSLALEVAEREGLAAVLAPEVSRLGSDYVFAARVIEPHTRRELLAVRAAASADRLLEGVETLSREVRSRLGEASAEIRRSKPLPEVTTSSLEALKMYAQAVETLNTGVSDRNARAGELAAEAVRLDSSFAMAWRLLGVTNSNLGRSGEALASLARANELSERLTDRERLHVEALHQFLLVNPRRVAQTYELILSQYPDDARAANNLAVEAYVRLGERERAYRAARRAHEINPNSSNYYENMIIALAPLERWAVVDSLIDEAESHDFGNVAADWRLGRAFAFEDWVAADALCDSLLSANSGSRLARLRGNCGSMDVARGRIRRAIERLDGAARYFAEERQHWFLQRAQGAMLVAEQIRRRPTAVASRLERLLSDSPAELMGERDAFYLRTQLRVLVGLGGRLDLIDQIEEAYPPYPDTTHWEIRYGEALAAAASELARGDAATALETLLDGTAGDYEPSYWRTEVHVLHALALEGLGQVDSAIARLEMTTAPGLLSTQFWETGRIHLPFVLRRLAELEESRGHTDAAARHYKRFIDLWSGADPELQGDVTAARGALARLTGSES